MLCLTFKAIVCHRGENLPVSAFVGADAAEATGGFEVGKVLLDGAARHHQRTDHPFLRKMRIRHKQRQQLIYRFLTAFF